VRAGSQLLIFFALSTDRLVMRRCPLPLVPPRVSLGVMTCRRHPSASSGIASSASLRS